MKICILLLCPMQGNGGIASWTKKIIDDFPNNEYRLYPVDIAPDKDFTLFHGFDRWIYGVKSFIHAYRRIKKVIRQYPIQLMHTTTSGGYGVLRDFFGGRYCKEKGLKTILHCHFGSVSALYKENNWRGRYFRKTLILYDQIWVLDQRSADFLRKIPDLRDKVFLVPNSINVPSECDLQPKSYRRIGFVGNIIPTKGIFELTKAAVKLDNTELYIAGQGLDENIEKIKTIAGQEIGKSVHLMGRLSNQDAVKLIETLDILALPTYYWGEAFPISILEAMSRGKLVIACPRAAIPDMLTAVDGTDCGLLVHDRDDSALADAITWCQQHSTEADEMCRKAYEKVWTCYRKEVVYDIYRRHYRKLL